MDIQGAAVTYLLGIPEVVNAVGKTPVKNTPYIFRDENLANIEHGYYTAVSAIIVEDAGPVTSLEMSSFRGRRLRVTIWANGDRDVATGNFINPRSARLKLDDTFKVVDKYLHRKSPDTVVWAGIHTISCNRSQDLSEPVSISDGDGIMIASAYYTVYF